MSSSKMSSSGDNSYLITGKLCPPRLPMHNLTPDGWNSLTAPLLELICMETAEQEKQTSSLNPLSALSFQARVWLSTDELSASSVVCLPYFFCNFCDYHTNSKGQLLRHTASRHIFQCSLCDFITITRYDVVQHQLHKHLDAKDVQPVLGFKNVHINLSILQRNLQNFPQCDNSSSHLSSSNCGNETLDQASSSQRETSTYCSDGHRDDIPYQLNDQTDSFPVSGKEECPVTFSKLQLPLPSVDTHPENSDLLKGQVTHSNTFSKRHLLVEENGDSELSSKKCRPNSYRENKTNILNASTQSHSLSFQMPHFLDESDSNVTSSCSPYKNTSPLLFESSRSEQMTPRKSQIKSQDTNHQVLSFLMEPISSSASGEMTQSHTTQADISTSSTGTTRKTHDWHNDDQSEATAFKETEPTSPFVSQAVPKYSTDDSPTFLKASREDENDKHHDSGLSLMERLSNQQGHPDVLGNLFMESCKELLDFSQGGSHVLLARDATPVTSYENSAKSYGACAENERDYNISGMRHSGCQQTSAQSLDNFLVAREDTLVVRKRVDKTKSAQRESDNGNNFKEQSAETSSNVGEEIKYDLLRKLLIGSAGVKEHAVTVTSRPEIDSRQSGVSVNKENPVTFSQSCSERKEPTCYLPLLTRASDMSLKDLLTNNLDSIPSSASYSCCYCNLKTSSKVELRNHIEICKYRDSERTKLQNTVFGLSGQAVHSQNFVHDASKSKSGTRTNILLDNLYTSDNFMASDVLKSLSEHYSESLSSDISMQDKSNTPDSEFPAGEKSDQLLGLGKTSSASHDVKLLRYRPARKKPEVDYSYESSDSSSSYNTDSDYKPNSSRRDSDSDYKPSSGGTMKKRTKRRQSNKHTLPITRQCVIAKTTADQPLDHDHVPQKQPEIPSTYACLYCTFCTFVRTNMQQHLFEIHTEHAPFAETCCKQKGKVLIYFCRGVQSECSFSSSDSVEIFEHIKLCYCGYLDSFVYCDSKVIPDYSQALFSLGEASKCIDNCTVMFHCLRCPYSAEDFQQVATHVSTDHVYYVAGVLCVNKVLKEPKVRMVCLLCNTHVPVKQWALHSCRKHFIDSNVSPSSRLKAQSALAGTLSGKVSEGGADVLDNCQVESDSKKGNDCFKEDCKSDLELGYTSLDYIQNQTLSRLTSSQFIEDNKSFFKTVDIKLEIPDVYLVEEKCADITAHFPDLPQAKADPDQDSKFPVKDNQTRNSEPEQQINSTNSAHTYSKNILSGSSVLQSLLTAPRSSEVLPKNFSMLHNLLKADHAVNETVQCKPLNASPADLTGGSPATQLQYPYIMDMLCHHDRSVHETHFAERVFASPKPTRQQTDKNLDHSSPCGPTAVSCSLQISSQQSQNAAFTKCFPNISTSTASKPYSVSVHEQSPPPLNPRPPLLPVISLDSPSPPLSLAASFLNAGSQDVPGPFANLLRLLSKTQFNSGSL